MESPKNTISSTEKTDSKFEQSPNIPIIDVIRHGETERKQNRARFHEAPVLDVDNPDFKLNTEHLDLKEEGIASIKTSADQLVDLIDKEKEIILIVSSPAWRTHSSALVLEKVLREKGINILNEEGKPKFSKAINQHSSFFEKTLKRSFGENDTTKQIIEEYKEKGYRKGLERVLKEFEGVDINKKMDEAENLSFQRFLRHMSNIYNYLSPDTIKKLKGKRLRIVVLAHEETTRGFIEENMPSGTPSQANSQILEIIPQSKIKLYPNKK